MKFHHTAGHGYERGDTAVELYQGGAYREWSMTPEEQDILDKAVVIGMKYLASLGLDDSKSIATLSYLAGIEEGAATQVEIDARVVQAAEVMCEHGCNKRLADIIRASWRAT